MFSFSEIYSHVLANLCPCLERMSQLVVPDKSPSRDRPEEERVALRLGALDKVSLEADEKTELEREKQVGGIDHPPQDIALAGLGCRCVCAFLNRCCTPPQVGLL